MKRQLVLILFLFAMLLFVTTTALADEKDGFSYTGESYSATTTRGLNLRDSDGELIRELPKDTKVYVLGISTTEKNRAVVEWQGQTGTLLTSGLEKQSNSKKISYKGESYTARTVRGLNFRNAEGELICEIPENTDVHVLGISTTESNRAVIVWQGQTGTVLANGLKKQTTSSKKFSYTGESYVARTTRSLNLRDADGELIKELSQNTDVHVLGISTNDPNRAVIEWQGLIGTVLANGLKKQRAPLKKLSHSGESYYAATVCELNLRDTEGQLIRIIPAYSLVYVKGVYDEDSSRSVVVYNEFEGTVLRKALKAVEDAIFVDIGKQTVKLFKEGELYAESSCVTGMRGGNDTPNGAFKVNYMKENTTLSGTNRDGTTYVQDVDYWIRFFKGCGFHDASWRSSFGKSIYTTNGSHGCVNLPYSFAKVMYENAYLGMPVYIAKP